MIGIIVLWIIEGILSVYLFKIKINEYQTIPLMMINNQEGIVVLKKSEKKILYQNSYGYIHNKKVSYDMIEEEKLEDNNYIQVRLKLKKRQKNESITITIKNKRISMMDGIIHSWGGDKNNKS